MQYWYTVKAKKCLLLLKVVYTVGGNKIVKIIYTVETCSDNYVTFFIANNKT